LRAAPLSSVLQDSVHDWTKSTGKFDALMILEIQYQCGHL
jgi:hypothetical protein